MAPRALLCLIMGWEDQVDVRHRGSGLRVLALRAHFRPPSHLRRPPLSILSVVQDRSGCTTYLRTPTVPNLFAPQSALLATKAIAEANTMALSSTVTCCIALPAAGMSAPASWCDMVRRGTVHYAQPECVSEIGVDWYDIIEPLAGRAAVELLVLPID